MSFSRVIWPVLRSLNKSWDAFTRELNIKPDIVTKDLLKKRDFNILACSGYFSEEEIQGLGKFVIKKISKEDLIQQNNCFSRKVKSAMALRNLKKGELIYEIYSEFKILLKPTSIFKTNDNITRLNINSPYTPLPYRTRLKMISEILKVNIRYFLYDEIPCEDIKEYLI